MNRRKVAGGSVYVRLRADLDGEIRQFATTHGMPLNAAINLAVENFFRDERLVGRLDDLLAERLPRET